MNTRKSNPFPHGIDLTAPGGLDRLFAFNRARFGDAQMKKADDTDTKTGEAGAGDGTTPSTTEQTDPPSNVDTGLSDAGKRALAAERDRADKAEKALRDKEQAEMSELDRAKSTATEATTRAEKLAAENLRLTAIADAEVAIPKKYHVLVRGSNETELAESIAAVTELIKGAPVVPETKPKQDVIPESGTNSGKGGGAGGSVAAGREMYKPSRTTPTK